MRFSPKSWCNPDVSQSEISEPSEKLPSALSPVASSILDFWQFSDKIFPGEAGVEAVAFHGERMRSLSTGRSLIQEKKFGIFLLRQKLPEQQN